MSLLVIMRGMTGAGKSALAQELYPTARICSADHYFEKKGIPWDIRHANRAHDLCWEEFNDALDAKAEVIVIDNNNLKPKEYDPYVREAQREGYTILIFQVKCHPMVAARRSKHRKALEKQDFKTIWRKYRKFNSNMIHYPTALNIERWTSEQPSEEELLAAEDLEISPEAGPLEDS